MASTLRLVVCVLGYKHIKIWYDMVYYDRLICYELFYNIGNCIVTYGLYYIFPREVEMMFD